MEEFHQHRCDVFTNEIDFSSPGYAVCKLFSHALEHFGSIEKLHEFVKESKSTKSTIFDFDFSDPSKTVENYVKLMINSMPKGWKNWKIPAGQMKILKHYTEVFFFSPDLEPLYLKHKAFIDYFFDRAFKIVMTQTMTIGGFALREEIRFGDDIERVSFCPTGASFCGIWHAMAHSCCNNTDRIAMNGKFYIFVTRPIKAGQELTTMKQ
jgi:SET domain